MSLHTQGSMLTAPIFVLQSSEYRVREKVEGVLKEAGFPVRVLDGQRAQEGAIALYEGRGDRPNRIVRMGRSLMDEPEWTGDTPFKVSVLLNGHVHHARSVKDAVVGQALNHYRWFLGDERLLAPWLPADGMLYSRDYLRWLEGWRLTADPFRDIFRRHESVKQMVARHDAEVRERRHARRFSSHSRRGSHGDPQDRYSSLWHTR